MATVGHSQANAVAERAIQTLHEKLNIVTAQENKLDNWDIVLPIVAFSINSSYHNTMGFSPYEIVFGRRARVNNSLAKLNVTVFDLHNKLVEAQLNDIYCSAVERKSDNQLISAARYNLSHRPQTFEIGEQVMLKNTRKRQAKFEPRFSGPYEIVGRSNDVYTLKDPKTNKQCERHTSSLKPFQAMANSTRLIQHVLLISIVLLMINTAAGTTSHLFDEVNYVIWRPADSIVVGDILRFNYTFIAKPPCELFECRIESLAKRHISRGKECAI